MPIQPLRSDRRSLLENAQGETIITLLEQALGIAREGARPTFLTHVTKGRSLSPGTILSYCAQAEETDPPR